MTWHISSRRFRRSRRRRGGLLSRGYGLIALMLLMGFGAFHALVAERDDYALVGFAGEAMRAERAFAPCGGGARVDCVVDGDTFWFSGEKVRIADIDTPEIFSPACAREKALGEAATRRLVALLNAGPIELRRAGSRDTDRYGRLLRTVHRNDRSLGAVLVAEGLARRWDGSRRSWCT